jgi:urease accessory protein
MLDFHGHLALRAAPRADGTTQLAAQSFRAPYHLGKAYWEADTRTLLVQVVNPTAGILAGDRLECSVAVEPGAAVLLTTPSASRVFRMRPGEGEARVVQHFQVAAGAWLEVLPEPLVPHRGCRFQQHTTLDLAPGGSAFYADLLFPGRIAHGETWSWERCVLELEVQCGPTLVLRERLDQSGADLRALAVFSGLGTEACFGNAVFLAPGLPAAPSWREALHALQSEQVWIGCSALRSGAGWSIKFITRDAIHLRETLAAIRRILAPTAPHLACDARKL